MVDELTAQIAAANIGEHFLFHLNFITAVTTSPTVTHFSDRKTNAITLAEIQATLQQQTTALHAAQARAEAAEANATAANAAVGVTVAVLSLYDTPH